MCGSVNAEFICIPRTVTIGGTDANGEKFKGKAVYDKA